MTLPNFLIIGAAKSGTTALHEFINQHPEIYMSSRKELRFFSNITSPPSGLSDEFIHSGVSTLDEYKSYFENVNNEKVVGESSPMYLYIPGTAERIKAIIPDVKILAILRNPVDRAYSAYMHAIRDWKESSRSFSEALEREEERIDAGWGMLWHYKRAGLYYEQLDRYYRLFQQEKIKVVLYDDLVTDASSLVQNIFEFLDVNPEFIPDTNQHPNVSGFPRSPKFHSIIKQLYILDNPIKRISRKIIPKTIRQESMTRLRLLNMEKRPMPEKIRHELIDFFQQDIKKLENLICRDLTFWLQ